MNKFLFLTVVFVGTVFTASARITVPDATNSAMLLSMACAGLAFVNFKRGKK
jgi:hypothetical protein